MPGRRWPIRLAAAIGGAAAALAASTGTAGASWPGEPPTSIVLPAIAEDLGSLLRDVSGAAEITFDEIDWYTFVAPVSGTYAISTATPGDSLDTVLGVFGPTGSRIAYNDDGFPDSFDSKVAVHLTALTRYYVGITNYSGTWGGSYQWTVDRPK